MRDRLSRYVLVLACWGLDLLGAQAQDADLHVPAASYPRLVPRAPDAAGFVPPGWRLEKTVAGDLNGDGHPDALLVLRDDDPNKRIATGRDGKPPFDTNPRILAVVFAKAAGGYDLALQNHTLVARTLEPFQEDPLDPDGIQGGDLAITKGTLRLTLGYFGGDMGRITYTFRFQNGRFELIGYDRSNVTRNSGVMTDLSINYSTARVVRKVGHISEDSEKVTRSRLTAKRLLTMDEVGDGLTFSPLPPR